MKTEKASIKIVEPLEVYLTDAEEISLKESLKDLNTIRRQRQFAIQNIVEIFEHVNKRKDINWRKK